MRLHFVEPLKGQSRCYAFKLEVKSRACFSKQVMHSARQRKSHFLYYLQLLVFTNKTSCRGYDNSLGLVPLEHFIVADC